MNAAPALQALVFNEALRRALDETSIEYSHHGAQHEVYAETISAMRSFLQENKAELRPSKKIINVDQKPTMRQVETFTLIGQPFERPTFIPNPLKMAKEIQADQTSLIKLARKYAIDPQYGYAFALLFLTFKNVPFDTIKSSLSNKQWLDYNQNQIIGRKIKEGHPDGEVILKYLHSTLMVANPVGTDRPTTDPNKYIEALGFLGGKGFAVNQNEQIGLGYARVVEYPRPLVVLLGMTELAERQADSNFLDPGRHKYIFDKFGGHITSRVITAYLIFD